MPAIAGAASPMTAISGLLNVGGAPPQGAGADGASAALMQTMQQIRDLGQQVDALAADLPALQPEVQQIQQILKRMVIKAAQAPVGEPASGMAVPTGGGM